MFSLFCQFYLYFTINCQLYNCQLVLQLSFDNIQLSTLQLLTDNLQFFYFCIVISASIDDIVIHFLLLLRFKGKLRIFQFKNYVQITHTYTCTWNICSIYSIKLRSFFLLHLSSVFLFQIYQYIWYRVRVKILKNA